VNTKFLAGVYCLTLLPVQLIAQPGVHWARMFDGGRRELFTDIYAVSDGGYVMCGYQRDLTHAPDSTYDAWVVKADDEGRQEWLKSFGALGVTDQANGVIETDDQEFMVVGTRNHLVAVWLISSDGDLIWSNDYGNQYASGQAAIELKSGEYVIAGKSEHRPYLLCINHAGDVLWERQYGEGSRETLEALRETEGGIVAAGSSWFNGSPYWRAPILKVDFNGDQVWLNYLTPQNCQMSHSMVSRLEGGFALVGEFWNGDGNNDMDNAFFLTDEDGNLVDSERIDFGEDCVDMCAGIVRLGALGYAFVGTNANWGRPQAICVTPAGQIRWTAQYEMDRYLENAAVSPASFQSVIQAHDQSIMACGSVSAGDQLTNGLLMKLEPEPQPQFLYWEPEDTVFSILPNDTVNFMVRAQGPQGFELECAWFIEDSVIAFNDSVTVVFDSLALGVYDVQCRLTVGQSVIAITWHVNIVELYISNYTPDFLALTIRRGSSQSFSLDTVRAVEGDQVEYQWTLTDLNTFEREETGTEASATVEFLRSGNYRMEGLAYRGESSDNVIWTIAVRSAILDFWPRSLRLSVLPDSSGEFGVIPFNSESDSLSYRWEVDGDSVGSDSTVTLRFVWDGQAGSSTYAVYAIVMDGAEGDTVRWEVTVQDPNATPPTPPSIEGREVPATFGIVSASPNPFNSSTTIRYTTSGDAYPTRKTTTSRDAYRTRLTVHDLTGREVARLVDERAQQSPPSRGGSYAVTLNGKDLPAGIYLVRLQAGEIQRTAKVVLVR